MTKTSGKMLTINDSNIFMFGFDFTIKKITFNVKHRTGVVNVQTHVCGLIQLQKNKVASGVFTGNQQSAFHLILLLVQTTHLEYVFKSGA